MRLLYAGEDVADRLWRGPEALRPVAGGLLLGLLLVAVPQMYGVGYPVLLDGLTGKYVVAALIGLLAAKMLATSLTMWIGGSGGVFGKGFMMGTQSHLSFLPERQTDFIFTMLAEEFGLVGCLTLLALYTLIFIYGFAIAFRSRSHFGRLLALGLTTNFFLYVFINTAMVMGLIPVVGVPLPLISYGGTAMLTVMFGFGLLISVYVHRDVRIGRRGEAEF